MAKNSKTNNSNPLLNSNFVGKLFFWWLKDTVWRGRRDEDPVELYDVMPNHLSEPLRNTLESAWEDELKIAEEKNTKPSMWKVIKKTYYHEFMKFATFVAGSTLIVLLEPELLKYTMLYFEVDTSVTTEWAYITATLFVVVMFLKGFLESHGRFQLSLVGMRAKIACSSLIFKKLTRLSLSASQQTGSSTISLLSIDVPRLELLFIYTPYILMLPLQIVASAYLIWRSVGFLPASTGIILMVIQTLPVQALYYNVTMKLRAKQIVRADKRISLISEVIGGIRSVKMSVWGVHFDKIVRRIRSLEVQSLFRMSFLTSVIWALSTFSHRISSFAITQIYRIRNGMIKPEAILPVIEHLFNLRTNIGFFFFAGVRDFTDMRVSMRRIEDFLMLDEVDGCIERTKCEGSNVVISLQNVTASWSKTSADNTLESISIDFEQSKSYAVVGPTGSGKSSLLKLITGELRATTGKILTHGKISYASQDSWIFSGSIRDNILFGEIYDADRYARVTEACALAKDFNRLPYRDRTLVGDRGLNISGGQAARINMARAVYRDADVYMFDDPLSAVDRLVAKELMDLCIHGLLKNKTKILVTHNVMQLNNFDEVIQLQFGRIESKNSSIGIQRNRFSVRPSKNSFSKTTPVNGDITRSSEKLEMIIDSRTTSIPEDYPKETEELLAKGPMKKFVYQRYIKAGGPVILSIVIAFNAIFIASVCGFDYGITEWIKIGNTLIGNQTQIGGTVGEEYLSFVQKSLWIFACVILLIILSSTLKNLFLYKFMYNASRRIHDSMFVSVLKTPLRFFEINPPGRILNRFSEDTSNADNVLPLTLFETIQTIAHTTAIFLPVLLVNWWNFIPLSVLFFIYMKLSQIYIPVAQKIKRTVGIAKSPILSLAASTLDGLMTIRSCQAEKFVCKNFDNRQDQYTAAHFLTIAIDSGFMLYMYLIVVFLFTFILYSSIILKTNDTYAGYIGLSLMQIVNVASMLAALMAYVAETLAHMVSVERMLQFTELDHEVSTQEDVVFKVNKSWPSKGKIEFRQVYLKYSTDSEPILSDVNFVVEAESKVGIVGRTGAGKSSLISALLRLGNVDGTLFIDGIDVKQVNLENLRSRITVIPQEPVLFNDTLRKNLDPLSEFEDSLLWSALEDVNLNNTFTSLNDAIDQRGNNLSTGQRKLLCLARAIIKNNKIIVLDEATANVDLTTETLIQKIIRQKLKDCTILSIAHRLNSILDNDKVLVMDNGQVIEYDSPHVLLQNSGGLFYKMIYDV